MVEALSEDGTIGIGTSVGGEPACYIIEKHLNRFVEGQVRILSLSLSISNRISDTTQSLLPGSPQCGSHVGSNVSCHAPVRSQGIGNPCDQRS